MASSNKSTYSRRLFIWLVGYSLLLMGCFVIFQYNREKQYKAEEMNLRLQALNDHILEEISSAEPGTMPSLILPHRFNDLRVSIISLDGKIIYDNTLDSLPDTNHLSRSEIAAAMATGSGYATRRHSESTGGTYFYSAKKGDGYIVRTAVPYSMSLQKLLKADFGFLWIVAAITATMCIIGFLATRRLGQNISRLNQFADRAERGERIFDSEGFPHDELGEISSHIVRLYARLQQAVADRDREHRLAMHEQQEKIRIKKQLTNNINHELKTPLAAMQVCLETLLAHPELPEGKRQEFLQRCYNGSDRLHRLLNDVSLITRMDDGHTSIDKAPLDLCDIIAEACYDYEPLAHDKGITIFNGITGKIPFNGNQSLLSSVFRNLIDNAIAYSGGTRIDLCIAADDDRHMVITVSDNGVGIPEEHLPRIFERFYRIDKGRSRSAGGTGLGLAIVRNALAIHGATITAENRREGGLMFRMTIPKS